MVEVKHIAVIGGGNGAFAASVHLTMKGFLVSLCDPYMEGEALKPLLSDRLLNYVGMFGEGAVKLHAVTSDVAEATNDVDLIMVCTPATAHSTVAKWLASVLRPGQTILLNPGHTGGALNFRRALHNAGYSDILVLGETSTLTYITRKKDPKTVWVEHMGEFVSVASLPAANLSQLLAKTSALYPKLNPTRTVLGTSLRNLNAMMHPPGMILGAAWIEHTGGDFFFYQDAATPGVGRLMEAIDRERLQIAEAWDEPLESFVELMWKTGITTDAARESGSLQRAFLECEPNRKIKAPPKLDHRYMHEDMMHGLVPMIAFGQVVGVNALTMNALVHIASMVNGIDYQKEGLNLEKLGLAGMDREEIRALLE
jgi:opine dehydrogenase